MSQQYNKLKELERKRKITIGLKRDHSNNFWYRQTIVGKLLNWLSCVLFVFAIIVFLKVSFTMGLLTIIAIGIYTLLIQKIGGIYVRNRLLREEDLFNVAYQAKSITLRNNSTGKIVFHPIDWREEINEISY